MFFDSGFLLFLICISYLLQLGILILGIALDDIKFKKKTFRNLLIPLGFILWLVQKYNEIDENEDKGGNKKCKK